MTTYSSAPGFLGGDLFHLSLVLWLWLFHTLLRGPLMVICGYFFKSVEKYVSYDFISHPESLRTQDTAMDSFRCSAKIKITGVLPSDLQLFFPPFQMSVGRMGCLCLGGQRWGSSRSLVLLGPVCGQSWHPPVHTSPGWKCSRKPEDVTSSPAAGGHVTSEVTSK